MRVDLCSPPDARVRAPLSKQLFERAIRRERNRCERCSSEVALIRVELPAASGRAPGEFARVLESVSDRVRAIDEIGWLGPRVAGILLPETGGEGAWTLAGDLRERDATGLFCACRIDVYVYPEGLPEGQRLLGVVSSTDVVRGLARELQAGRKGQRTWPRRA